MENIQRLITEQTNLRKNRKYMFYAIPANKNKGKDIVWECGFPGPDTEIYRNAYFVAFLKFPHTYPYNPPTVTFKNPVYHPNVYTNKHVCLDLISHKWKPSLNVQNILCGLQQLLITPNIKSLANTAAGKLYKKDIDCYNSRVMENNRKYHTKPKWK